MKYTFNDLIAIIAKLRSEDGCAWDREQTHESMVKCLFEESEEVAAAIKNKDMDNLCEELGDMLFLLVFHGQLGAEENAFTIDDVIQGACEKMIRRHPHVFGDVKVNSPEECLELWKEIKKQEKEEKSRKKQEKRAEK